MMRDQFGPLAPIPTVNLVMASSGLVAAILNGFLLRVLAKEKLTVDVGLMAIIAVSDMIFSLFIICCLFFYGVGHTAQDSFGLCLLSSVVINSATVVTPVLVAQLSLVRYLAIVRCMHVSRRYLLVSIAALFLIWGMFLWRGLTSELVLLPSGIYCTPLYWGTHFADKLFGLPIVSLALPSLLATPICYYCIMKHYWTIISFEGHSGQLAERQLRRQAKYVTLFMAAYCIAFIPELSHVLLTLMLNVQRTSLSDGIVMALLFTITITNSLFALLLHEDTRLEFSHLMTNNIISFQSPLDPL